MRINVPKWAEAHFWDEPPEGSMEFWAFRFMPMTHVGDGIEFFIGGKLVARAVVYKIERPGESSCDRTGGWANRWKVYWSPESFEDVRPKQGFMCFGPDWWGPIGRT